MTDLKSLENDALKLVELALKAGADACDVVVAKGSSQSVSVRDGNVENSELADSDAVYLRVFCGKKLATVTGNQLTGTKVLAERAVAMARVSPEDPFQGLAEPDRLAEGSYIDKTIGELDLYDPFEPDANRLEEMAKTAEAAGLEVEGIEKSMGAGCGFSHSGFVLATSQGFSGSYQRSGFSCSAMLVAGSGTGMERDYDFDSAVHFEDLDAPEKIGRSAGERTIKRLSPRQVASGAYPVIFDPRVANSMAGTLAGAINGASIARKTSFLRDRMGKQVANPAISLIDDPLLKRRSGSRAFDGEGVVTERLNLVDKGELTCWLLDSATARELDLRTNGRASRGVSGTNPTTTNCYIEAGCRSAKELIGNVKEGLYLTETIGHGINMVTGNYSKGAAGFWIENGELAYPVAEVTVAGNLADMFRHMVPADDLEFKYGTNAPTLLIEGMTVGGK